jgi:hypothetical protein
VSTDTAFTLDEALAIVRNTRLSRAAVETSTPEEIVWLTAKAIEDGFRFARPYVVPEFARAEGAAHRAVDRVKLGDRQRAVLHRTITREFEGWPS